MTSLAEDLEKQVHEDIGHCTACKKCLLVCPLPEARGIDIFHLNREILSPKPSEEMQRFAFLCMSCGACNISCPENIRRDMHMVYLKSKGKRPKGYNNLLHWRGKHLGTIEKTLYSLKKRKDKPHPKIAKYLDKWNPRAAETLFYFACYAYSPSTIPEKTLSIADYLKLEYEVLAGYGHCCGWPHFLAGDFDRAQKLFLDLFNTIDGVNPKRIVTGCAECYRALVFIRDRFAGNVEVMTTPEWMLENIQGLPIQKIMGEKATFHDACQLTRLDNKEETPRKLIHQLYNNDFLEMENNRENTLCCGAMRAGHEPNGLLDIRKKRLHEAKDTGADVMITECVSCYEKFNPLSEGEGIKIIDLTDAIHDSIENIDK